MASTLELPGSNHRAVITVTGSTCGAYCARTDQLAMGLPLKLLLPVLVAVALGAALQQLRQLDADSNANWAEVRFRV